MTQGTPPATSRATTRSTTTCSTPSPRACGATALPPPPRGPCPPHHRAVAPRRASRVHHYRREASEPQPAHVVQRPRAWPQRDARQRWSAQPEQQHAPGGVKTECSNCSATHTPLWRRGLNDELNCNTCGLYCKLVSRIWFKLTLV